MTHSIPALAVLAILAWAACAGPLPLPAPIAPEPLTPEDGEPTSAARLNELMRIAPEEVATRLAHQMPTVAITRRVRWTYHSARGSTSGRGTVTITPPDTLRFDFRAPFGRRGGLGAVGDRLLWSDPDSLGERLVDRVPLLWAALGIPRTGGDSALYKREPTREVFRFVKGDTTLTYTLSPLQLTAVLVGPSGVLGSALLRRDSSDDHGAGHLRRDAPLATLQFVVERVDTLPALAPDWFTRPAR
ncbi:MAG TPA: hypothetical protein VGA37_00825 [Gemmatimonadales bacterium]